MAARAFSARALQGKSLWPSPVIDALTDSGERVRMSFHTPADRMDFARGRRLVEVCTRSRVVDATFSHNGCDVEEFTTAKARKPTLARQIAAILDTTADPLAALAAVRSLVAA